MLLAATEPAWLTRAARGARTRWSVSCQGARGGLRAERLSTVQTRLHQRSTVGTPPLYPRSRDLPEILSDNNIREIVQ